VDEAKWEKVGLLAGIGFVVLAVVGGLIAGTPPKPSDGPQKIADYFKDNQDALKIGSYLTGLGLLLFLWFLASLFGRLRRAEGGAGRMSGIALTGGVVAVAIAAVGSGIAAYGALHIDASPGAFQISTIVFGYVGFATAALAAGVAVVSMRTKLLPAWFAWASEGLALLWLVSAASVSTENDTINVIGFITFLVWAVWIAVLAILLYRTPDAPAAS